MGTVAKTVADAGCEVTGFLPEFFFTRSRQSKLLYFVFHSIFNHGEVRRINTALDTWI